MPTKYCAIALLLLVVFNELTLFISSFGTRDSRQLHRKVFTKSMKLDMKVGGKLVVTGIGSNSGDEFGLNLFNEQQLWDSIVLATSDSNVTKKRFLSRTARYSGLLNILNFQTTNMADIKELTMLLTNADAWIAYNVTNDDVPSYTKAAIDAEVKRVIFTSSMPDNFATSSSKMEEFENSLKLFIDAGASFTGIRHGTIIEGDEDNSYEIVNSTTPCSQNTVEYGVLSRVTAELLQIDESSNKLCGVSSSGEFALAYLNVLRSTGLDRSQEVKKMFTGGLQRISQLTVQSYEEEKKRSDEKKALIESRKAEEALELQNELELNKHNSVIISEIESNDDETTIVETDEMKISKRTDEILQSVWREFQTRMYAKSTSKSVFFESNKEMARELAQNEFDEKKQNLNTDLMEEKQKQEVLDKIVDANRRQYAKLLSLERKEMQSQKEISDTWVKYIYILLESTMDNCRKENILFHNLDEYTQTLLLRNVSNSLRKQCNLAPYEVVYDPLDASVIVDKISALPSSVDMIINRSIDDVLNSLYTKYGSLLKSVSALRGASQIINAAIETLKAELPTPPPTVNDLRRSESLSKQTVVSQLRLEKIKNRGKPTGDDSGSDVGRL